MPEIPTKLIQWLRLGAAVFAYEQEMRRHILTRMQEMFPDDWANRILEAMPDRLQFELRGEVEAADSEALQIYLEVRHFPHVVVKHQRQFGEFNDQSLIRMGKARELRNSWAHPGMKQFKEATVRQKVHHLASVVRRISPELSDTVKDHDNRIKTALERGPEESPDAPGVISKRVIDALQAPLGELSPVLGAQAEQRAQELRDALASAHENVEDSARLVTEARNDRERARKDRQEAARLREEARVALDNAQRRPPPREPMRQPSGQSRGEIAPRTSGETPARPATDREFREYRGRFRPARSGNGSTRTTDLENWRITRWVGMSRGEHRACVWAPESRGIKAGEPLINEGATSEDTAFRLLFDLDRSGAIRKKAEAAIAAHERPQSDARDPAPTTDDVDDVPF